MSYPITQQEENALLQQIAPQGCRNGHVHFRRCNTCGLVEWVCSDSTKPDKVTVSFDLRNCMLCAAASQRAPEVHAWVIQVFNHQLRTLLRAPPTPNILNALADAASQSTSHQTENMNGFVFAKQLRKAAEDEQS